MSKETLLASPYQETAFAQAEWNGFTYARAVSFECRVSHPAANGILGALAYKRILTPFLLYGNVRGFRPTRFACTRKTQTRTTITAWSSRSSAT